MVETFRAMVIDTVDGKPAAGFREVSLTDLPDNDVLVEIAYSTLNYKDGLAITGKGRIARRTPLIAGIDISGTVVESRSAEWKPGDKVIVNGWGLSETEPGAYGRYQRVKAEWLIPLPEAFSLQQAMAIGTAGYTSALCVDALEKWGAIKPGEGEVLVTGAAGGVGSVAIALLSARGYNVTASTGRPETHPYLESLGATNFIDRAELQQKGGPLQKERWTGGVDSVGSTTLANALAQTARGGDRRLWSGGRCGSSGDRSAAYPAQRCPDRCGLGHGAEGAASFGMEQAGARSGQVETRRHHNCRANVEAAGTCAGHHRRPDQRPCRHRRHRLSGSAFLFSAAFTRL